MNIVAFLVVGLIAGLIARFVRPGPHPVSTAASLSLGLAGAFIGGLLVVVLTSYDRGFELTSGGLVGAVVGAFTLLLATGWAGPRPVH
jgi:uncharacterized membrane protein YeaQ/YmgE (transglycosylase-associated protein family)